MKNLSGAEFSHCARCFAPATLTDLGFRCNRPPCKRENVSVLPYLDAPNLHVDERQAYAPCIETGCNRIRSNLHVAGCPFPMSESLAGARQTELVLSVGTNADDTLTIAACCLVLSLKQEAGQTPQISAVGLEAISLWTKPGLLKLAPQLKQLAYPLAPASTLSFVVGQTPPRTLNLRLCSVADPARFEDRLFSFSGCVFSLRGDREYARKNRLANISRVQLWMSARDALSIDGRAAIAASTEAIARTFEPRAGHIPLIVGLYDDTDYFGTLGPRGSSLTDAYSLPVEERERILDAYVLHNFRLGNIAQKLFDSMANVRAVVATGSELYSGTLRGLERWCAQVKKGA